MTVKLRKDSQIPAYMAYPRFLLTADLSETAKLVYPSIDGASGSQPFCTGIDPMSF